MFRRRSKVGQTVRTRRGTRQRAAVARRRGNVKADGESVPPSAKRIPKSCGLAAIGYFMATHLLFSIGLSAPKALGNPQYLAPVAQVMR